MKKKIKLMVIAALIAAGSVAGINAVASHKRAPKSSLVMANVEAMSRSEVKGYMYVVVIHYEKGDGCNCAGDGTKICCL